jgi:beta-lactamase regulating signal transducer with metallopeptidase domain
MMDAFALYLMKSVIWLSGFALVFILFLRNERFFLLNRIYLITGILVSFFFPLISIHYTVVLPSASNLHSAGVVAGENPNTGNSLIPVIRLMLSVLYVAGVLFIMALIIRQGRSLLRSIKKSEIISFRPVKLIKTHDYTSAFSFFSYVFVNPSITDIETKEIMNHELVHIRQKHWFDLLLVEMLCMMQWFNPLVWIYVRFIRQNHEYLADEVALQRTSDPAIYRAVLLNQIVGAPVVSLTNSFNYSPNKKRFNMMKNIIRSPYRKMKILLVLPVFVVVLYAFAKPDYRYQTPDQNSVVPITGSASLQIPVDGIVAQSPLTPGMKTPIAIDTIKQNKRNSGTMMLPPPPPPPPVSENQNPGVPVIIPDAPPPPAPVIDFKIKEDGPPPLYVVDGIITTPEEVQNIDPETIGSVNVMKDKSNYNGATLKYGDKGKNGVVEIFTKKYITDTGISGLNATEVPPPPLPALTPGVDIRSDDGKTPLYVVDGVVKDSEFDLNQIDQNKIQSIKVLKDESAVKKYGEKAKNGAIEIITK